MWKWFGGQLKTTFLSINDCFRPILVVDDSLIPPAGAVFYLPPVSPTATCSYMVLLQLTTRKLPAL
jgi:hypothetical protein